MRMMKWSFIFLLVLAATACDMMTPPWKRTSLEKTVQRPVTCVAGADCEQKWARALQWLQDNSDLAITTQSDTVLQTAESPPHSPLASFMITKLLAGGDKYEIHYTAQCSNLFGCTPPLLRLKAGFIRFVMDEKR